MNVSSWDTPTFVCILGSYLQKRKLSTVSIPWPILPGKALSYINEIGATKEIIRQFLTSPPLFQESYPRKKYGEPTKWRMLHILTWVKIASVITYHKRQHPGTPQVSVIDLR